MQSAKNELQIEIDTKYDEFERQNNTKRQRIEVDLLSFVLFFLLHVLET